MQNLPIAERRNRIAVQVLQEGSTKIRELAVSFGVTTETIRKDLLFLEEKGLLRRSHGGALSAGEFFVRPVSMRLEENIDAKNRIAKRALEMIPEEGIVFLDPGSTVFCLAKLLKLRSGLVVVTNALNVAALLSDSENTVYLTGGKLIDHSSSLNGLWTGTCLESIRLDVAFLGTSGVQNHKGPTSEIFEDAQNKRTLLNGCGQSVVLMDASKRRERATVSYADWRQIDYLITDESIPHEEQKSMRLRREIIVV